VGRLDDKVLGGGASKSQCSVNAFWGFANLRPLAPPHVEPAADSRQVCGVGMQVCELDRRTGRISVVSGYTMAAAKSHRHPAARSLQCAGNT
jgi:hypothetical protein